MIRRGQQDYLQALRSIREKLSPQLCPYVVFRNFTQKWEVEVSRSELTESNTIDVLGSIASSQVLIELRIM